MKLKKIYLLIYFFVEISENFGFLKIQRFEIGTKKFLKHQNFDFFRPYFFSELDFFGGYISDVKFRALSFYGVSRAIRALLHWFWSRFLNTVLSILSLEGLPNHCVPYRPATMYILKRDFITSESLFRRHSVRKRCGDGFFPFTLP